MRNQPTIIKQMARALSELKLEEGRIYKSNTIWSAVRKVLGMSVTDTEWKRVSANIKRQLVDIGAIERVPGKYQMKVLDCQAIATFTRTYTPHRNPRQQNLFQGEAGKSKTESMKEVAEAMSSEITEIVSEENPLEGLEESSELTWEVSLKESVIIKLLNQGVITLSDIIGEED